MANVINTRIQLKIDTLTNWNNSTFIPLAGEVCIAKVGTVEGTTLQPTMIKVGDGTNKFADLDWLSAKAADVYGWAKAKDVELVNQVLTFKDATGTAIKTVDLSGFTTSQELTDALTNYYTKDAADAKFVAIETGKRLMTDDEGTKLSGIEAGAQVNDIETVKVNGTALTITDKAVDITVPTTAEIESIAASKINTLIEGAESDDTIDSIIELVQYVNDNAGEITQLKSDVSTANTNASNAVTTAGEAKSKAEEALTKAGEALEGAEGAAASAAAAKASEEAAKASENAAKASENAAAASASAAAGSESAAAGSAGQAAASESAAETAQGKAEKAQAAAESAKAGAEAAKSAADSSKEAAAGSASAAAQSAADAGTAKEAAETAKAGAEAAQSAAAGSASEASASEAAAKAAQAGAEAAKEAAEASNTSATAIANEAKSTADAAKTASENATKAVNGLSFTPSELNDGMCITLNGVDETVDFRNSETISWYYGSDSASMAAHVNKEGLGLHTVATSGSIYDLNEVHKTVDNTISAKAENYIIFSCGSATALID